jgi:drug/metabolite transporter (DMT)-like permease
MTQSDERQNGVILIAIGTIFWSSAGLFIRLILLDPWTLIAWRSAFGFLMIGGLLLWRYGRTVPGMISGMGSGGVMVTLYATGSITLFIPALQHTSITNAMTIYAALPFIVAAIAWAWLGERPPARTIAASFVAALGLLVMLGGPGSVGVRLGDLFAVAATLVSALMTVQARRSRNVQMLLVACLANLFAIVIALPLARSPLDLRLRDIVLLASFGLFAMALGMMLYLTGTARVPAATSALIGTLTVPASALWAWAGVGETPTLSEAVGAAIVLGGVLGALLLEQRAARIANR